MNTLFRLVDRWVVPFVLGLTWVLLIATSDVSGVAVVATLFGFAIVVVLYAAYKELRVHAAASRHAAQGDPDELLALAEREIASRWLPRSKVPFHIYRSIALQQKGQLDEARVALTAADLDRLGGRSRRSWGILHAAQRINLLTEAGDAAAAREVLERDLEPHLRYVPGAGAEVIGAEARARVLYAEGKLDEALPIFERLGKDVRLGPSTRAVCRWYAGDPDAQKVAPKIALPQKRPTSATPTPSGDA